MPNRREFIQQLAVVGILSSFSNNIFSQNNSSNRKIWACLLHLSYNMWVEYSTPSPFRGYRPYLQLSEDLWNDALTKMAQEGINMVVIDLGDAIKYESHPEIAVNNALTTSQLRSELVKIRRMGIEPIPKLNFAAGHDTWLGEYSKMVSTKKYYEVCKNLINEVVDLFDKPRFFHLGMDEENLEDQKYLNHVVIRQNELWWHDFYFLVDQVEKQGARTWVWSDYLWHNPELFFKKMPKSVIQSNWYYGEDFDIDKTPVKAYIDLEKYGYDQIPTGSFHSGNDYSILNTVKFCTENIAEPRLLGFLQTFWAPTIEANRASIIKAIELTGNAKKWHEIKSD